MLPRNPGFGSKVLEKPFARDPAIDGLRGVAILLVYVFHYGGGLTSTEPLLRLFGYVTQAGWIGVDLFFALSGFLITRLLWADRELPGNLPSFYARRALRILPLYFGALALAACAALWSGAHPPALRPLLLYLAFLQNIPPLLGAALRYPPPLPLYHLWSLAVEEQFYLLWPLALLVCRTRTRALRLCFLTFVLCCLFRNFVWGTLSPILRTAPLAWSVTVPARAGALALGSALALAPMRWHVAIHRVSPLVVGLGLGGFLAVGVTHHGLLLNNAGMMIFGLPCVELLAAALVAQTAALADRTAARQGLWRTLLSTRPLSALGRISYGFYVFHIPLEPMFDSIGRSLTHTTRGMTYQAVRFLVAFPLTVAVASMSYGLYERPFLRCKRRFSHSASERVQALPLPENG